MAQIREVRLIDDIDGEPAVETVPFAFEGRHYEIDLSIDNAAKLRDVFAAYVAAGRRTGTPSAAQVGRRVRPATVDREQNQAIRDWARRTGMKVSARGRIPGEVLTAFHQRENSAAG